jgi:hypothetical protein
LAGVGEQRRNVIIGTSGVDDEEGEEDDAGDDESLRKDRPSAETMMKTIKDYGV